MFGDLDWMVMRIEVRWYGTYLCLTPPMNRTGKHSSLCVHDVLIGDVLICDGVVR